MSPRSESAHVGSDGATELRLQYLLKGGEVALPMGVTLKDGKDDAVEGMGKLRTAQHMDKAPGN